MRDDRTYDSSLTQPTPPSSSPPTPTPHPLQTQGPATFAVAVAEHAAETGTGTQRKGAVYQIMGGRRTVDSFNQLGYGFDACKRCE